MFERVGPALDDRPKIVVICASPVTLGAYSLDGWFLPLIPELERTHQVVFIGSRQESRYPGWRIQPEHVRENTQRSAESPDARSNNREYVLRVIQEGLDELLHCQVDHLVVLTSKGVVGILPLQPFVPQDVDREARARMNEFHDAPHYYSNIKNFAIDLAPRILQDKVSSTGFSTVHLYCYLSIFETVMEHTQAQASVFIIDPSLYYQWFEQWGDRTKLYYFKNDFRGTRNFHEFPLAELQHCVYEEQRAEYNMFPEPRDKLFIFAGSVMYDKGTRTNKWSKYLRDLNIPRSSMYIPLRANGANQTKRENSHQLKTAEKKHAQLYADIQAHPMWKPAVLPNELIDIYKQHRYGLILSCVSQSDSLNFRPVNYVFRGVLPLLDPGYDPDYLQIPKNVQDQTRVNNADDIEERINYFEAHPEERDNLIDQLYHDCFKLDKYSWDNRSNTIDLYKDVLLSHQL